MVAGNDGVQGRSQGVLEAEKSRLSGRLGEFSESVRDAGRKFTGGDDNAISRLTDQAANSIDQACNYLGNAEPRQLVRDATDMARRRPEVFIGGALLAGLMLGRFLRSTPEETEGGQMLPDDSDERETPMSSGFTSSDSRPDTVEGGSW
jgi:hypothetical protein